MADISLNENRLALLIWQISNLWQSRVKLKLKHLNIGFNEYLILETLSKLQQKSQSISQQDICKQSSMDRSVVSLRILKLEKKNLITKIQPKDRRSNSLILTSKGNNLIKDVKYIIEDQEKEMFDKLGSEIFNFTNSLKLLLGKKIRIRAKIND